MPGYPQAEEKTGDADHGGNAVAAGLPADPGHGGEGENQSDDGKNEIVEHG